MEARRGPVRGRTCGRSHVQGERGQRHQLHPDQGGRIALGNTAIALADEGKGWYLLKVATAADAINAVAGATAPTASLAAIGADGLIKATAHGLTSGDYVSYSTLGAGTTVLTGLTSGST